MGTTVGRLALLRVLLLLLAAAAAWPLWRGARPEARYLGWLALLATSLAALLCAGLVSHAAASPTGRGLAVSIHVLHLVAAAAWIGSLAHLLAARALLRAAREPAEVALVADVVRRFSPLALCSAALIAVSGGVAAWASLGTPRALVTSAYGLTLIVKLLLVATLLVPAWVNYRVVRPALARAAARASASGETIARLCRMIELEVTAGLLVVAVAGILGSVSPPLPDGTGSLTPEQARAILTPRLPQTQVVDPQTWLGSATRSAEDLRYSELMHGWSGVVVALLGLAWLLQARGRGAAHAVGRLWPWLLVPFAAFIAIASDPEVWPMGHVHPLAALRDPVVLEHRIGALMVVVLVWLGLRDERRRGEDRPLGRALPVLMIVGSLLLLGHAHSSFASTDDLGTLIDFQHALLGGLGLLAGTVRWLELRGLFPRPVARWLWPSLVVAIGLVMALSYRELV